MRQIDEFLIHGNSDLTFSHTIILPMPPGDRYPSPLTARPRVRLSPATVYSGRPGTEELICALNSGQAREFAQIQRIGVTRAYALSPGQWPLTSRDGKACRSGVLLVAEPIGFW